MISRLSLLLGVVLLSGCKTEEVQTVQYYLENDNERLERLETCEVQDRADDDANCVNARAAQSQLKITDTKSDWQRQIEAEQPAPTE